VSAPVDPDRRPDDPALLSARRRRRSIALGAALALVVLIFYILTIVKLGPAIFNRDL